MPKLVGPAGVVGSVVLPAPPSLGPDVVVVVVVVVAPVVDVVVVPPVVGSVMVILSLPHATVTAAIVTTTPAHATAAAVLSIRDAKIDSLYEGTTAIQALDFFFRKIVRDRGDALAHVAAQIGHTIDTCDAALSPSADLLRKALDDVQAMTVTLTGYLMAAARQPTQIHKIGLASVRFLLAVGDLLIGRRLLAQADIAKAALSAAPTKHDETFYQGKIATAAFFAKNMLPNLAALRGIVESLDDDVMRLPEAAF